MDQNPDAGTSFVLDNWQIVIGIAQDVDLTAASGDLSVNTNIGTISLDGTVARMRSKQREELVTVLLLVRLEIPEPHLI